MDTRTLLQSRFNVSLEQARDWVLERIGRPEDIYNAARSAGLTNSMLAEIVGIEGVTGEVCKAFFSARGLRGEDLDDNPSPGDLAPDDKGGSPGVPGGGTDDNPSPGDDLSDDDLSENDDAHSVLPDELAALTPLTALVAFNTRTGDLSNESLRAAALARGVTSGQYDALFSPTGLDANRDGSLSGSELGIPTLPSMAATTTNLESLVYGTLLNLLERVDSQEARALDDFSSHSDDSAASEAEFAALLTAVFEDVANPPLLQVAALRDAVAGSVAEAVLVGVGGEGPLERLFEGIVDL